MSPYDYPYRTRSTTRLAAGMLPRPGAVELERLEPPPAGLAPLVLVVDDHDDSRAIARLVLESAGFRVAEARTGFEGFRMAVELRPALVLLDMILPGLDGWEIARLLRTNTDAKSAVIIAVTAVASAVDQDRALLAGCDEVLTKPVPPGRMLDAVRRHLSPALSSPRAS